MFSLLLLKLDMKLYLYAPSYRGDICWVYSLSTSRFYANISTKIILANDDFEVINIHNKDNLDKALLLISLGLPHKEIEEVLGEP